MHGVRESGARLHERTQAAKESAVRPTIGLVGGDGNVRGSLAEAASATEGIIVGASDLEQLRLASAAVDVLVAVVEAGGDDILRQARVSFPEADLVAVVPAERRELRRAFLDGAAGIVPRERLAESLAATITAVLAGHICVPSELRTTIVKPTLSTREKQVLGMVVMGLTNGEIARRLVLAESTVKSHLSSAFSKLGVRSRSEAVDVILDTERGLGTGILAISGAEGPNGG